MRKMTSFLNIFALFITINSAFANTTALEKSPEELVHEVMQDSLRRESLNQRRIKQDLDQLESDIKTLKDFIDNSDTVKVIPELLEVNQNWFLEDDKQILNESSDGIAQVNTILAGVNALVILSYFKRGLKKAITLSAANLALLYYYGKEVSLSIEEAELLSDVVIELQNIISKKQVDEVTTLALEGLENVRESLEQAIDNREKNQEFLNIIVVPTVLVSAIFIARKGQPISKRMMASLAMVGAPYFLNNNDKFKKKLIRNVEKLLVRVQQLKHEHKMLKYLE